MNRFSNDAPRELIFKFILIGDAGVGKTSILQRYTDDNFDADYNVTVGAEFGSKYVKVDDETCIKLQIWDTAGQVSFLNIVRSFYNGAHGVFLIYNVNKRETFENIKKWKADVKENIDPNAVYVLMGNQVDSQGRQVSYDEGISFMQDNNIHFFFEISAKTGANVELAFDEAAKLALANFIKEKLGDQESMIQSRHDNTVSLILSKAPVSENKKESCNC